jgi:hypothetical protein
VESREGGEGKGEEDEREKKERHGWREDTTKSLFFMSSPYQKNRFLKNNYIIK